MRSAILAAIALCVAALLSAAAPAAGSGAARTQVYFLQGEQLVPVSRPGSTLRPALASLLAGPSEAEAAKQFRTLVPPGTRLRSVRVENGVATIDLGESFAAGRNAESLSARIAQLVFTATAVRYRSGCSPGSPSRGRSPVSRRRSPSSRLRSRRRTRRAPRAPMSVLCSSASPISAISRPTASTVWQATRRGTR